MAPRSAAESATSARAGGHSYVFADQPKNGTTVHATRFATNAKTASRRSCRVSPAFASSLQKNPATREPMARPNRYAARSSPNAPGRPQLANAITRYQRIS